MEPLNRQSSKDKFEAQAVVRRKKMTGLMEKLEARRHEVGVVTIGKKYNNNVKKVDIFLAEVEVSGSPQDGGATREAVDNVVITPEGFFAIRHYTGTEDGKMAFREFKAALEQMWEDSKTDPDPNFMNPDVELFYEALSGSNVRLRFYHPWRRRSPDKIKYGDNGRLTYNTLEQNRTKEGILLSSFVSADPETIDRAYEASKARVERINMPPIKSLLRDQQTIQAADSLLDKLEGI